MRLKYELGEINVYKLENNNNNEGKILFAVTSKEAAESSGRLFIKGAIIFQDENYNYVIPKLHRFATF